MKPWRGSSFETWRAFFVESVSIVTGVDSQTLMYGGRERGLLERQFLIWAMRELIPGRPSYPSIGVALHLHHTTAIHAHSKIERLLAGEDVRVSTWRLEVLQRVSRKNAS